MTEHAFTNAAGIAVVRSVLDVIRENRDYLSELDGAAGDGDHGINMSKGAGFAATELDANPDADLTAGFQTLSRVLMSRIGGSMGPLYGSLFLGLASASQGRESIDREAMASMLDTALQAVRRMTDAQVGDKTLMDVLVPSVAAFDSAVQAGLPFDECVDALATAASAGLESTRGLVAKVGRASRLGDRSIGHLDAGAASCSLILTAIGEATKALLES